MAGTPTRRCPTRTTTALAITAATSPWTMVEPVHSGGQPKTNGWGSSTSRACGWKLSTADSPANRSTTTAQSTSSWPDAKRSTGPSRQRQGTIPHSGPGDGLAVRPYVPREEPGRQHDGREHRRCSREDDPVSTKSSGRSDNLSDLDAIERDVVGRVSRDGAYPIARRARVLFRVKDDHREPVRLHAAD